MNSQDYRVLSKVARERLNLGAGISEILADSKFLKMITNCRSDTCSLATVLSAGIDEKAKLYHLAGFIDALLWAHDVGICIGSSTDTEEELLSIIAQKAVEWESDVL